MTTWKQPKSTIKKNIVIHLGKSVTTTLFNGSIWQQKLNITGIKTININEIKI